MTVTGRTELPVLQLPVRTRGCCNELPAPLDADTAAGAAALFRALADPTRVQMVHMLRASKQPVCVCDFTAAFELGQPTISHHLARLREAGLVRTTRRGVWAYYELRADLGELERAVTSRLAG
jgi:ArsR family transcriptional regulator